MQDLKTTLVRMAPSLKKKVKKDNVVKLITEGKLSGYFDKGHFSKLAPLVSVPLWNIISVSGHEGHIFLGFTKSGQYILSYTNEDVGELDSDFESTPSDSDSFHHNYFLHWWEFNLPGLKLVQRVKLFACDGAIDAITCNDLYVSVCEWPSDDSRIVVSGFGAHSTGTDQLMVNMDDQVFVDCFVTVAPNPPSKPCGRCRPVPPATRTGECLEHGYVFHSMYNQVDPLPRPRYAVYPHFTFQPALQLKKHRVVLLKVPTYPNMLSALAVYLCPPGEQSRSSQILYSKRAAPPPPGQPSAMSTSTPSPASSSSSPSMLPQGSNRSPATSSSSHPPTLPSSSSQEADLDEPGYLGYTRLHYHLPQPGAAEQDAVPRAFCFTDLEGRDRKLVTGPHDGQSLCVEELALDIEHFLQDEVYAHAVWGPRMSFTVYNLVLLEVCPETDKVLMDVCLFLHSEEHTVYQSNLQVSWDLNTGLCCLIGVGDLTEATTDLGSILKSHRESCVNTVMGCPVPENSSLRVNVMNEELPERVMADTERCTWVLV